MSIKINRFESKEIKKDIREILFKNKTGYYIKDHKIDVVIGYINLADNKKENEELANRIINTIENYIEEKENATEN